MHDWYCPMCGGQLTRGGVYCATCKTEPGWEWRPAGDGWQKLADILRRLPPPTYPEHTDD
jgi:uncharacterized Zn finger protein (UPF0148 family)